MPQSPASSPQPPLAEPPVAPTEPHVWDRAGGPQEDLWAWLRDRDDPRTIAYLEAENDYTAAWFAPLTELREQLFQEIKGRIKETDQSVPARKGPWWYLARTVEGRNYRVHCRGSSAETAATEVLLDENVEANGHGFFEVGRVRHQPIAPPAGVVGRHRRRRGVRAARPRPDHGRRSPRPDPSDLLRHRLVGRRPVRLLHRS